MISTRRTAAGAVGRCSVALPVVEPVGGSAVRAWAPGVVAPVSGGSVSRASASHVATDGATAVRAADSRSAGARRTDVRVSDASAYLSPAPKGFVAPVWVPPGRAPV